MVLQTPAERLFDRAPRFLLREGGKPVLQVRQVLRELRPDDVGAGGEELSELDVARAEARQRGGDARLRRLGCAEGRSYRADGCGEEAGEAKPQWDGRPL